MRGDYEDWESDALCKEVGPEVFYPSEYQGTNTYEQAVKVCNLCSVKAQCLERALRDEDPHGMWGGVTPTTRLRLLQERHGGGYRWPVFDDQVGPLTPDVLRDYCKNNLHPMKGDNIVYDSSGFMRCSACRKIANRRRNARRKSA